MTQIPNQLTELQADHLERIVREVLNLDQNVNIDSLTAASCPAWDSLRHVELALRLQKFFKIKLTSVEMLSMRSVYDIRQLVARHIDT